MPKIFVDVFGQNTRETLEEYLGPSLQSLLIIQDHANLNMVQVCKMLTSMSQRL